MPLGMKDSLPPLFVDVRQLKVGMFVHLDVGWMGHPFALNSFKLTSDEQIATIRSLGVDRIRWDPARSDPGVLAALQPEAVADAAHPESEAGAVLSSQQEEARRRRREMLAEQQASLSCCEREFTQAARAFKQVGEMAHVQPDVARQRTENLVDGFIGQVDGVHDTCIRLLTEAAGDRASTHSLNVTVIAMLLGRVMGMHGDALKSLGVGAMLHDIGKIDLPDRVRWKDEHFSLAEMQFYQEHVAHGISLARKMQLSPQATLIIAQHHEHMDGSGFPSRLAGERIHVAARIVGLVNRYDNLCNPHNPARSLTPHEALSLMFAQMKARFDATILSAFIKMMGVYPPGSVVQLTDDRHALVVSVNSSRPLKPRVVVHDPKVPRDEALILDLEAETTLGIRRSLKPQQLPKAALDYLSPRQRICYFFERAREADTGLDGKVA